LSNQQESHFQSWDDPKYQREPPQSKNLQVRPQTAFQLRHFKERSILSSVCWLGRQVPALAASIRSPQSAALRIQDPGLYNDQSAALLPGRPFDAKIEIHCAKYFKISVATPRPLKFSFSTNSRKLAEKNPQPVGQIDKKICGSDMTAQSISLGLV